MKDIKDSRSELDRLQTLAMEKLSKRLSVSDVNEHLRRTSFIRTADISQDEDSLGGGSANLIFGDIAEMKKSAKTRTNIGKRYIPITLTPADSVLSIRRPSIKHLRMKSDTTFSIPLGTEEST